MRTLLTLVFVLLATPAIAQEVLDVPVDVRVETRGDVVVPVVSWTAPDGLDFSDKAIE